MIVVMLLNSTNDKLGYPRRAWAAWDCRGTGQWRAIDRFSGDDPQDAKVRLLGRLRGEPVLCAGPELSIPAAQLYAITDACSGQSKRAKARQQVAG